MRVLFFFLFPISLLAQVEVAPYMHIGARAWGVEGATFKEGPDNGAGVLVHPVTNDYTPVTWVVNSRVTYTSLYHTEFSQKYRFVHFKGGLGLSDGKHIHATLNLGYLYGLDDYGGASATVDVAIRLVFPDTGRFNIFGEACGGSTLVRAFPSFQKSHPYISAGVGVQYRLQ